MPPSPRIPAPLPGAADDDVLHDTRWREEARFALVCAGLLLGTALVVDAGVYGLALSHALGWTVLAALLLVVLLPARVSVAPGLLTVQGLWVTRTVRSDRLAAVTWPVGTGRRLLLRDEDGARAEIDLRVLLDNPALWLRLEAEARAALRRGALHHGAADLARLSLRVHAETARSVLKVSGLG
ncbi:hypothetical protein AB0L71_11930 [Streptomyces sp. NPDC052052]|uniref:hypothetical protein n=1 Tax=Streptomyces sp. NPDC052052 TaxID=3154756 RepID=UPI0034450E5F